MCAQVFTYEGVCEQFFYRKPADPLAVDGRMQGRFPRAVPWLKPAPGSLAAPSERFKQEFFQSNRTGARGRANARGPWALACWARTQSAAAHAAR